jgi:hypothetical protein
MPTRRRLLGWTAASAALGLAALARPRAVGASSERARDEETARLLDELILRRALDSTDAWLEMHVVLALGADVVNGRGSVLDQAVARSLELGPAGFRKVPHFPIAVERHPFHFLQVMQATGVPPERVFVTPQGRFSHKEILDGTIALFDPEEVTDELSWAICVLTRVYPPGKDEFVNASGEKVVVSRLVERHLRETEAAYADTLAAMEGKGVYKRGVIHTKACNGTHLLYGLVDALAEGYGGDDLAGRFRRLVAATLFRLRFEPLLIDKSLPGDLPMVRLNADAAKFTFLGHVIEDLGQARRRRVYEPSPPDLATIGQARGELGKLAERLGSEHDLDQLSTEVPGAYRVLLGDACHALRGIRMWL